MKKLLVLAATHLAALGTGFALGIYVLPILIAPPPPEAAVRRAAAAQALFTGAFRRDLEGSDGLHWGEGKVLVGRKSISLEGRVAPGPDYKLYLSPEYVQTHDDVLRVKSRMVRVGDVKTFENFVIPVPESIDPSQYTTVLVWCETFGKFISAAKYR